MMLRQLGWNGKNVSFAVSGITEQQCSSLLSNFRESMQQDNTVQLRPQYLSFSGWQLKPIYEVEPLPCFSV
jgi:hypothetical protein